ncbi:hypothetical protein DKX38_007646 [Salix brachista]|uniref:Uncharacterized protein n=1 Tax=Salix brachista TaxID=2182728 RepID=A0A5N5MP15_9ROSI|nr:hypothetical protein DKX38_007646 [Salix brachista]
MLGSVHHSSLLLGLSAVASALHYSVGLAHPTTNSSSNLLQLLLRKFLEELDLLQSYITLKSKSVQKDVIVIMSARPFVRYKDLLDDVYTDVSSVLKSCGDVCAIVYCLERTTCDGLCAHLSKNGISSAGS